MSSSAETDSTNLLQLVLYEYRGQVRKYRGEFGLLDPDKWFKELQVDYFLEVFLANLNYTTFLCESLIDQSKKSGTESFEETMPDYELGYQIAEDCTSVLEFAKENSSYVRSTLTSELLISFIQYFNISNSANRFGWLDVNKRIASAMVRLIQFNPELEDIFDEWAQDIDDLDDEDLEDDELPRQALWKHDFINFIREYITPSTESL